MQSSLLTVPAYWQILASFPPILYSSQRYLVNKVFLLVYFYEWASNTRMSILLMSRSFTWGHANEWWIWICGSTAGWLKSSKRSCIHSYFFAEQRTTLLIQVLSYCTLVSPPLCTECGIKAHVQGDNEVMNWFMENNAFHPTYRRTTGM